MRNQEEERVRGARDQKATLRVCFRGGGERMWSGGVTAPLVAMTASVFRFWKNMEKSTDKRRPLSPLAVLCIPSLFLTQ